MKKSIHLVVAGCITFFGIGNVAAKAPVTSLLSSENVGQIDVETRTGTRCDNGLPINYVAIDGVGIWGDIGLGSIEELSKGCISIPVGLTRTATISGKDSVRLALPVGAQTWPTGIVPYVIGNDMPQYWRAAIQAAVDHFSAFSPVRFIQRTNEAKFVLVETMTLPAGVCGYSEAIGMAILPQKVVLQMSDVGGCAGEHPTPFTGTVIHEFMHVLGFMHEHLRSDRDNYLVVNSDCPDTNAAVLDNFLQRTLSDRLPPYDYASVMHYGRGDCKKGSVTTSILIPKADFSATRIFVTRCPSNPPGLYLLRDIGQSCALSEGNVQELYYFYGSTAPPPTTAKKLAASNAMLSSMAILDSGQNALAANYQGLWWNAPAGSESGWGINFAHQGDIVFATWFTYDASGKALWLSMTANKSSGEVFTGTLFQTRGPAFSAVPFTPSTVSATSVGIGSLTFTDSNNGRFAYTLNGISQTKNITRQVFGPMPTCSFGTQSDLTLATNYQDLWWVAPAGSESGWGVNFAHQGDSLFATWFTYDSDGAPLWLSATAPKIGAGIYRGPLYRTTGPAFSAVPFLSGSVVLNNVGLLTVSFATGNSATFAYTVNNITQSKSITRQVFRTPGTLCQ